MISEPRKRWFTVASILLGSLILVVGPHLALAAVAPERSPLRPSASPLVVRRMVLGHSTQGRPVLAFRLGDPTSETKILIVGCIHGNECAGTAIARALIAAPPVDIDLWVVRNLNPDGFRAGTRQNGRGVDLNRNFPYRWRLIGRPWDKEYSGPHPLSEPEDRIARRLIARVHPDVSIWFHQPLGLVVRSAGDITIQRRFARRVGLPLGKLAGRYPGSVSSWQNHWHPEAAAFVVELPEGSLSSTAVDRYVRAIVNAATWRSNTTQAPSAPDQLMQQVPRDVPARSARLERSNSEAKAFTLVSWNVEHFKNADSRVDRVVDFLNDLSRDVFALYEVEGKEVFDDEVSDHGLSLHGSAEGLGVSTRRQQLRHRGQDERAGGYART